MTRAASNSPAPGSNGAAARVAAARLLRALLDRPVIPWRSPRGRPGLGARIRGAAATRLDRRTRAGVVVVADIREEQELLGRLVALVERGEPLSAEVFGTVQRLVAEEAPPPLPTALAELRRLDELRPPMEPRSAPPPSTQPREETA